MGPHVGGFHNFLLSMINESHIFFFSILISHKRHINVTWDKDQVNTIT